MSVGVGRIFESVYLSVCACLFVHGIAQKRMIQSVQTWCRESPWDTLEVVLFGGSNVNGQGHRVNN